MNETNKKTILVVDDSSMIRDLIKDFLKDKFNVIEVEDARECLRILAETKPSIDLGLIDIVMPNMTGFELIEKMIKHPSYAKVPFIMVTSKDGRENISKAVLAGACDYIKKPFDKETLLQKIEKHLDNSQSS